MKGKNRFTQLEIDMLRELITQKCNCDKNKQKLIRSKMRKMKFYIEDFVYKIKSIEDFDQLVRDGKIIVVDEVSRPNKIIGQSFPTYIQDREEKGILIRKDGLKPIVDAKTKILILGSLPGDESLKKHEYYAKTSNRFWKILSALYGTVVPLKYEDRIALLKEKCIGIWDVLHDADRVGSKDDAIDSYIPNDILGVLEQHPSIEFIAFNGKKAESLFNSNFDITSFRNVKFMTLLSSSGANCQYKLETLISDWSIILKSICS